MGIEKEQCIPLLELKDHLVLSILQKMEIVAYVFSRRTCQILDSFAEQNRKYLHIKPSYDSRLSLNRCNGRDVSHQNGTCCKGATLKVCGKRPIFKNKCQNLHTKLTARNFSSVFAKVSGISFHRIQIFGNGLWRHCRGSGFFYPGSLGPFFKLISEMKTHFKEFVLWDLDPPLIQQLFALSSAEEIFIRFSYPFFFSPFLIKNSSKVKFVVRGFSEATEEELNAFEVHKLIIPRREASLELDNCPTDITHRELSAILKAYMSGQSSLKRLFIQYEDDNVQSMSLSIVEILNGILIWHGKMVNVHDFCMSQIYYPLRKTYEKGEEMPVDIQIWRICGDTAQKIPLLCLRSNKKDDNTSFCQLDFFEISEWSTHSVLPSLLPLCFTNTTDEEIAEWLNSERGEELFDKSNIEDYRLYYMNYHMENCQTKCGWF